MESKIQQFFNKLPDGKRKLALHLREVLRATDKRVGETIKWNNYTMTYGKHNLVFIYTYPKAEYINLGFLNATSLKDPKKLFEGTGKGMRHIKIFSEKDIPVTQVKKWLKESVQLFTD